MSRARPLLCGIVVAATATASGHAEALYKRAHATDCYAGESAFMSFTPTGVDNGGSSISRHIFCPFHEDSDFPKTNATAVSISHTSDDPLPLEVKACTTHFSTLGGVGGSCGTPDTTAPYSPSLSAWTTTNSTAYVSIRLPPHDGTVGTMIHGIRFDD